jgi:hypothetical protein
LVVAVVAVDMASLEALRRLSVLLFLFPDGSTMKAQDLKDRGIYFGLSYEDENGALPILRSYQYVFAGSQSGSFCFRVVGSDDTLELTERQLDLVLTLQELMNELKHWEAGNPVLRHS